jgi:DNA-binding transcriptional MerR regulator
MAKGRISPKGKSSTTGKTAGQSAPEPSPAIGDLLPTGKLYYRIGEVSEITGVKTYVLRYWESEFRGMVPQKSRSKQRLYKRRDIEMILLIKKLLYDERYTIAGARQRIKELNLARAKTPIAESAPAAKGAAAAPAGDLDPRSEYARIREDLQSLRAML